jgi:KipI family sensor histidine kinase inhibitor
LRPHIAPLGDSALTLTFGDEISVDLSERVEMEAALISVMRLPGVSDIVPSYSSIALHYDSRRISYDDLASRLAAMRPVAAERANTARRDPHLIPVRYDGEDIEEAAQRCGLTLRDVIDIHSSREYRVFVIGFVPGFAYLGPLDSRLVLPRRDSPRKRVPAGSVAIAEAQTGVYPSETPGGWHLIGRTEMKMFDPGREKPALLSVGDIVRFVEE